MRRRGGNGANTGMVPPRGRGSGDISRTHGRDALSCGSGDGCRGRHDGGSRSSGGSSRGCKSSDGGGGGGGGGGI